jgi:hypothetical protein
MAAPADESSNNPISWSKYGTQRFTRVPIIKRQENYGKPNGHFQAPGGIVVYVSVQIGTRVTIEHIIALFYALGINKLRDLHRPGDRDPAIIGKEIWL